MKLKILLTGGAGYIGSHVAHLLIDKGHSVEIIDNLITGNKRLIPKKAKLHICDIANKFKVSKIINKQKFDIVMHFAGLIRVDESIKKPKKYIIQNHEKSKIFFQTCFENKLNKLIFSSSASVYGNVKKKALEGDKTKPLNPYALSKLKTEKFIIQQSKIKPISYMILRYFNVAGADKKLRTGLLSKHSTHLIKNACEVAVGKKDKLIINGDNYDTVDGTTIRDYIHVSDLADCGYGKGFSVKEVVKSLNDILFYKIITEIGKKRPGDSNKVIANTNKLFKYFSWKPKYNNLKLILKSSLNWEKKIKNLL